jgi:hypothetical protein
MNKEFAKMNQTQILTGFNTVALMVMLVWVIRTNFDFKSNLEDIRKEITELKQNSNDNTKRSTLSLSRLSQRLEDQSQKLGNMMNFTQSLSNGMIPQTNTTSVAAHLPMPSPVTVNQTVTGVESDDYESAMRALRM